MRVLLTQRQEIIRLRKQGRTYDEISQALRLRLAKSTLSYICRGVEMPDSYRDRIKQLNVEHLKRVRVKALHTNSAKQQALLALLQRDAMTTVQDLSKDGRKVALAMLYLGEGAKWMGHRGLALGSSDPRIILLYTKLLETCYKIHPSEMRFRILYRADQDIIQLTQFWAKTLGVSRQQFYKTNPDARTVGKPTRKRNYRGVCVVTSKSTRIQLELDAIANELLRYVRVKGM